VNFIDKLFALLAGGLAGWQVDRGTVGSAVVFAILALLFLANGICEAIEQLRGPAAPSNHSPTPTGGTT
jgi:hypothetical protein